MATLVFSYKDAADHEIRLAPGRTTLGRRPYNDLVLAHPTVSGEHAVLQLDGPAAAHPAARVLASWLVRRGARNVLLLTPAATGG